MTVRSDPPRRSRRAVRSAAIVGGTSQVGEGFGRHPSAAFVPDGAPVDQHLQHLLEIQRVPVRGGRHALDHRGVQVGDAQQVLHHPGALGGLERFEGQRAETPVAPAPLGMLLEQFPAGRAQQEHRRVTFVHDEAQEVEQRPLRPVDVVDQHDQRAP